MLTRAQIPDPRQRVTVTIDGTNVDCFEGDTVAAVILLAGAMPYRKAIVSGNARAPLCMMGICFECLVEVNGVPNQPGCLRAVEPGMVIRRQVAMRKLTEGAES